MMSIFFCVALDIIIYPTAVDLLVTVKNKAVDAYNEIMRMTV